MVRSSSATARPSVVNAAERSRPKRPGPIRRASDPLSAEILKALEDEQDDWGGKGFPSPSILGRECTRQLWFMGKGWPASNRVQAESILAMHQGDFAEPIVVNALGAAGVHLETQVPLPDPEAVGCAEGTADGVGETAIFEFKRVGLWRFLKIAEKGVAEAEPTYYSQCQLYMAGHGKRVCYLILVSADYSAVRWYWKRSGYDMADIPPAIWVERIELDPEYVKGQVEKARALKLLVARAEHPREVQAEFNPETGGWPCDWCRWLNACLEANR